MTVEGMIESWPAAFDRCRRVNRPMRFVLKDRIIRVHPDGRAEVYEKPAKGKCRFVATHEHEREVPSIAVGEEKGVAA